MSTTINSNLTEETLTAKTNLAIATTTTAAAADNKTTLTPLQPFWPTVKCANASENTLVSPQREQQLQSLQLANAPLSFSMPTTITTLLSGTSLLSSGAASSLSLSPSVAKEFLEDCQSDLPLIKSEQLDEVQQQQQQDGSNDFISADSVANPVIVPPINSENSSLNIAGSLTKSNSPSSPLTDEYCLNSLNDSCNIVQISKKPCTLDFYTSSGSQSKWYLPPASPAEEAISSATLAVPPQMSLSSSATIIPIDISTETNLFPSSSSALMMTKSMVSLAMPESSIVTPPSPAEEMLPSQSFLSVQQQQVSAAPIDKMFNRLGTATNDGVTAVGMRNGFPNNLSQQIRAISSPSLTDVGGITSTEHQRVPPSHDTSYAAKTTAAATATFNPPATTTTATQNVGVLQKFKRTFTNFSRQQQQQQQQHQHTSAQTNGAALQQQQQQQQQQPTQQVNVVTTSVTTPCLKSASTEIPSADVTDCSSTTNKYRFGPLIWRTSKERRKTKYNRRDKCNSGDSGIQIELENDEQFARVLATNGVVSGTASTGSNALAAQIKQDGMNSLRMRAIRRTNSAKTSCITDQSINALAATSRILQRINNANIAEKQAPESLPTRSLSQPNGLESCGMSRSDLEDSDSDSVTSHEEASSSSTAYFPIYAEVLYNFTAAGPQELGLEKGTLLEVLRKEVGPWWFGRIKKEDASLVQEILDPELGWFPKEFVRVIHSPETDGFFLQQLAEMQQREKHQQQQEQMQQQQMEDDSHDDEQHEEDEHHHDFLNTSSSPACSPLNISMEDACNTTVIDRHNVTTIVIETSNSTSSAMATSTTTTTEAREDSSLNQTLMLTTNSSQNILSTSQSLNIVMGSADILRKSAIKELLDTEVNYCKLLQSICEGYLPSMSKRIDIFSPNSIRLIFSNITAIYKFQRKFLEALRKGIEQNQVAKVFLKMHKGFLCYSTYCNAYPRALIELESYERVKDARTILENCRESENLAELPLSAHLLAPVQRICRYPLHLNEIIKTSIKGSEPPAFALHEYEQIDVSQLDIPDTTETIDMSLEAMKSITEAVNEGKRHSETIARHQASFQNFKGPPLHLHSTRFFLQIDATRQKQNLWNSSCTLFLFDNQLVYCKKDIIKRSQYIYKGRIFLDKCRVVNVRDGKMFGHTIKNSLRIYCEARDKWFDFSFRSANRKHRFLNTLALERQFGGKALYIAEMTGFEYAFDEKDCSDQSDYEGGVGAGGGVSQENELKLKEFMQEHHFTQSAGGNGANTSGESSVPESPAKSFKYSSDTLPNKKSQVKSEGNNVGNAAAAAAATTNGSMLNVNNENQTGSLGRRRLGNWFRKPKSSASTPNQSPTHKPIQLTTTAHSTGDLQLTGTDLTETYIVLEQADNGGVSS